MLPPIKISAIFARISPGSSLRSPVSPHAQAGLEGCVLDPMSGGLCPHEGVFQLFPFDSTGVRDGARGLVCKQERGRNKYLKSPFLNMLMYYRLYYVAILAGKEVGK